MSALSTQDILADLFPEQTILNLREGIARGTFGPFTPATKPGQSNERQTAELRRLRRQGRQSFGADPTFDSDREVLAMFDTLDADIQRRAARGDYARAGSQDELAYLMGFDLEARQFESGLDDGLADAITLGKFSPRAVITNQSIRKLMQPLHDSVLSKIPFPDPRSLRDSVDDQTAANGFMSDAQRVIEAQPDDETRAIVSEQLGRSLNGDLTADQLHGTVKTNSQSAYVENRNSGLVIDPQTPAAEDEDIERMNLIVRAASQFVNPALELVEQARPSTSVAAAVGTLGAAEESIKELAEAPWYKKPGEFATAWWALTKGFYTSGQESEQALRAARGDVTIDVPPAETFAEKAVDVGAGVASFVAQMVLLRRIVPADVPPALRGAVIFEMQSLSQGGTPGKGAVLGGALQGIGGIATKGLAGEVGKVAAESALFAGLTAAEGGDEVDIILAALVPVGLRGSSLARRQFRQKVVAAKTPEEISDVFRESRFFREQHAEAVQFVENASVETLARVRAKHAPRAATDPVSAAMVELIDAKGGRAPAPRPKPAEVEPVVREEPKQEIAPEVKPTEEPAKPAEEPKAEPATEAEPDALAVRANDRGLAEGEYGLPTGVLEVYTPARILDEWAIFDSIEDFTDAPRPLTWSEAVAEADRRNLEVSGVEGAIGIKAEPVPDAPIRAALESRGVSGDELLNVLDLRSEIEDVGARISPTGIVTLFHRTDPESAKRITESGVMTGKEDRLFFGTEPVGEISGFGEAIVVVEIPIEQLSLDDIFGREAHLTIEAGRPGTEIAVKVVEAPEAALAAEGPETLPTTREAEPDDITPQQTAEEAETQIQPEAEAPAEAPEVQEVEPTPRQEHAALAVELSNLKSNEIRDRADRLRTSERETELVVLRRVMGDEFMESRRGGPTAKVKDSEIELIEDRATDEEKDLIFRPGEVFDDVDDFATAASEVEETDAKHTGIEIGRAIRRISDPSQSLEEMKPEEQIAAFKVLRGFRHADQSGFDRQEVLDAAANEIKRFFGDNIETANEIIERIARLAPERAPEAPDQLQLPEADQRTRRELVEKAKELGIKSSGKKADILARVQEAEVSEEIPSEEFEARKSAIRGVDETISELAPTTDPQAPTGADVAGFLYDLLGVARPGLDIETRVGITVSNQMRGEPAPDLTSEETVKELALRLFRNKAESEGLDPEGLLGPISGLTPAGKAQAVAQQEVQARKILSELSEQLAEPPQITDPDKPNFDRRGFSLNFAAEAADAVLKGGEFSFRVIRETVSRMLAGVSSKVHGLLDRIVNLTSRIVGKSVNPDGTINTEAQTKAVAENQTQLRSHVDPNRWLPAERQHVQDVGRLRNIAPGAINQTQDAIAGIASRAVEGKRWTVAAQITAANNGFLNAIWNVIEDPIRPLRGNLDGSGNYSGDRMSRVLGLIDMHKRESMELRSKMTADITRALGQNAMIRSAGEAMGISGLQQRARTLADRTFVPFDRLNRAERDLKGMEGEAAEQQRALIASLTKRVNTDLERLPGDVQSGIRKAFTDFITARNDTARNRQMQTDASAYLNQVHRRWKDHAVVQFNSAEIRSAEDYDNAIRQIYGLPDPLDVTDEPTSIFQPGIVVKAADRENFGTVLKIDTEAETATVKFVNPRNGATAIRDLPIDTLTPTDGKVLVPTRRRIDGVNEVSTIELRDSAWWRTQGKDIDFATDRQFILDSMNAAQIAVNVKGETPRMNTLIENTGLHFADIDSSEFISGKRREAVSNHFINLANSELGLRGAEKQPTWPRLIEYARIMRDEAGLDITDTVSEQREIAAETAMIDLITATEGIQINQEDATGLIPTLFQAADSYSTAVQLVFSAASTANEMYQTTDLMIKHAGIVEGIGQIGRGVLVNLTKGMSAQMKTDFEELAWGLMSLDPYKLSRVDETTLAASQDPTGLSRSTSQQLNERPGISQWIKGVLLTGSRGAVEASLSGKVFGKEIPGVRQGSLDYWSTNLRQVGVLAEMGVLTKRIPDLAAIWGKLRSGEAENPGQAIKQLKAEKKLRTRITAQYYRLVAPRMQGQLERLAERLENGEGIKRMFGMNVFVGNEASDRAVRRYLDLFIMNVATNTPRRSDIPSVIQKQGAMRMLLRFLLKYQNQATAFMNGRGALTRTESSRGALFLVGGLMGYTMFEMFLRDVIRRGVDGAVERIEERLSTPEGVAIYGSQVLGRSNVLGPVDREIVPAVAAALAPDEYRRSRAIKDAAGGPVFGIVNDLLSVPFIFDQERSGDRLSTPEKRLLNRLLIVPSTPAGTLIRGLQMVPNEFPGSFIISDEEEELRSGIGLPN